MVKVALHYRAASKGIVTASIVAAGTREIIGPVNAPVNEIGELKNLPSAVSSDYPQPHIIYTRAEFEIMNRRQKT